MFISISSYLELCLSVSLNGSVGTVVIGACITLSVVPKYV